MACRSSEGFGKKGAERACGALVGGGGSEDTCGLAVALCSVLTHFRVSFHLSYRQARVCFGPSETARRLLRLCELHALPVHPRELAPQLHRLRGSCVALKEAGAVGVTNSCVFFRHLLQEATLSCTQWQTRPVSACGFAPICRALRMAICAELAPMPVSPSQSQLLLLPPSSKQRLGRT